MMTYFISACCAFVTVYVIAGLVLSVLCAGEHSFGRLVCFSLELLTLLLGNVYSNLVEYVAILNMLL